MEAMVEEIVPNPIKYLNLLILFFLFEIVSSSFSLQFYMYVIFAENSLFSEVLVVLRFVM